MVNELRTAGRERGTRRVLGEQTEARPEEGAQGALGKARADTQQASAQR